MPSTLPPLRSASDLERVLEFEFVRATENAALQAIHWLGRGEKELADAAACSAIYGVFDILDIRGEVVIGEGIKDNAPGIFVGEHLGTWRDGTPRFNIALDPIDGTSNIAKGLPNSISVIAAAQIPDGAPCATQAHKANGNGWKVVASGLDNPRGIALAKNGDIWIAEAGKGGTAPCFPGEEGSDACFGLTGAFTLVHDGWQKRVVTGLPSVADKGTGDNATGAHDVIVNGTKVTGVIGSGGNPDQRAAVPGAELTGHVVKIDPWTGKVWPFADLVQYEADNNPDGGKGPDGSPLIDSDAYGIAQVHGGFVVADAAGNDLLGVDYHKHISTLAVFPAVQVDAPPFLGLPAGAKIPMEAVPTSVAVRPKDPNLYVGQLTGFPFPAGAASVWGVKPDGSTFVYASGFTNIIDIAWGPKGSLYVLEISSNGLLSSDPTGALIKVWPNGTKTVVASKGLVAPTAVAIAKDGSVYVSNYGTSAGKGVVVNIGKV